MRNESEAGARLLRRGSAPGPAGAWAGAALQRHRGPRIFLWAFDLPEVAGVFCPPASPRSRLPWPPPTSSGRRRRSTRRLTRLHRAAQDDSCRTPRVTAAGRRQHHSGRAGSAIEAFRSATACGTRFASARQGQHRRRGPWPSGRPTPGAKTGHGDSLAIVHATIRGGGVASGHGRLAGIRRAAVDGLAPRLGCGPRGCRNAGSAAGDEPGFGARGRRFRSRHRRSRRPRASRIEMPLQERPHAVHDTIQNRTVGGARRLRTRLSEQDESRARRPDAMIDMSIVATVAEPITIELPTAMSIAVWTIATLFGMALWSSRTSSPTTETITRLETRMDRFGDDLAKLLGSVAKIEALLPTSSEQGRPDDAGLTVAWPRAAAPSAELAVLTADCRAGLLSSRGRAA